MSKDLAQKEDLLPVAELDFAAELFRDVLNAGTAVRADITEIGRAWREGAWRDRYGSWEAYLVAEHGIGPRRPAGRGPDARPVYFIQADGGPIKIGVAGNPQRRVADLQTSSPYVLRLIATIPDQGGLGESALHAKFAHLRMQGEWFQAAPELVAYIRENGVPA